MKNKLLLVFIPVIFLNFSYKENTHDVEYLLQKNKLVFNKSDSASIVKLFGTDFNFRKSWRHAKMRSGPDWNWTYLFLDYSEYGVRFKLTKQIDFDKVAKLSCIRIDSTYNYSILNNIRIREANFKELRERYSLEKITYSEDISDSSVTIAQEFKNYTFHKELKLVLDTNMNEERVIVFLDSITTNLRIDYIDIYRE